MSCLSDPDSLDDSSFGPSKWTGYSYDPSKWSTGDDYYRESDDEGDAAKYRKDTHSPSHYECYPCKGVGYELSACVLPDYALGPRSGRGRSGIRT